MALSSESGKTGQRNTYHYLKAIIYVLHITTRVNNRMADNPPGWIDRWFGKITSYARDNVHITCTAAVQHIHSLVFGYGTWGVFPRRKKLKTDKDYHAQPARGGVSLGCKYIIYAAFPSRSSGLSVWWNEHAVR